MKKSMAAVAMMAMGAMATTVQSNEQMGQELANLGMDLTPSGSYYHFGNPVFMPSRSQKIKAKRLRAHNQRCKRKKR